jgi:hypothetical protein
MERFIEARVIDSKHLELKQPIKIAPGSNVIIKIETAESIAEDCEWYQLTSANLEAAYGNDEPEYLREMIKKFNPDYQE